VEIRPQKTELAIVNVIACQEAWRLLTPKSRAALLALSTQTETTVHPASLVALQNHGLAYAGAITPAGEAVVRHRPDQASERKA
jgi:hypothetical protein